METESSSLIDQITAWFTAQEPVYLILGGIGALLVIVLLIALLRRLFRRSAAPLESPLFVVDAIQIAPLGRDAFVKVRNAGHDGVITGLKVLGRSDVMIKNDVAGHELNAGKVYSLLFEAGSAERLNKDFTLQFTYLDKQGNVYEQALPLDSTTADAPKLVMRRK